MKIFLSSTYADLVDHRRKAAEAIERLGQQGVRMEVFGARSLEATRASLDEVAEAEVFVGLYAHRYGYVPREADKSITEQEFDYAQDQRKHMLCFVVEDDYPWNPKHIEGEPGRGKLLSFKLRVRESFVVDAFSSPEDLAFKIASSLGRLLLTLRIQEELERVPGGRVVSTEEGRSQVARRASRLQPLIAGSYVLLVNDVPAEMDHVVRILKDLSIEVNVATTSDTALSMIRQRRADLVISDMRRGDVEDEGSRFHNRLRTLNPHIPVIFTVGRYDPSRGTPPYAFGITNRVDELLNLVFDVIERIRG